MDFPSPHLQLIRHLFRPARGGAAGVVIVFALLLALAAHSGFTGLPLTLLLTSWFFKYAYVLFDHTARGFDEPPVLDISMMNPIDEQRPAGQMIIVGLIAAVVFSVRTYGGPVLALASAAIAAFFLPASVAVLGLEGNMLKAANPVAWVRMIAGLGALYVVVIAVIAVESLGVALLAKLDLWLPVSIAAAMFFILSMFSLLAGAIYERRDELGIEAWVSPERSEQRDQKEALRAQDNQVAEAYGLMRAGAHVNCWEMLQKWLDSRGRKAEDYRWLCERVASWEDPRYITRLTEERVDRLLVLKRSGEALDVVSGRLRMDPKFRLKTAAGTLALARLAARGGGSRGVARILLSDFAIRYAGDPCVPAAVELASHLGLAGSKPG